MKKCLYFLTSLLTFAFIMQTHATEIIHDWTTPELEQNEHDPLTGYASKYSYKGSAADRWNPTLYFSSSSGGVSLYVDAELMNVGDETMITSWIEATSDLGLVSTPSKDGVRLNKTEDDWKGRTYWHDSKRAHAPEEDIYADAVTSYQKHPVAVYDANPINPHFPTGNRVERSFSHSAWASAWLSDEHASEELPDFNPYATGSLDVASMSTLGANIDYITFTTPWCTGSSEHASGPCPGP
jgi:hypothetical protein